MQLADPRPTLRVRPGWRGRLGILQPAPGLMLEDEWARAVPDGVVFPVTRLPLGGGSPDHYAAMAVHAPAGAAMLASAGVGVIGYACGVGSLHEGPDAERALVARLSNAAGGTPVVGMSAAGAEAMRHLGAERIAVLTPYPAAVNDLVAGYLEAAGFIVAGVSRLPTPSAIEAVDLRPEETIDAAVGALTTADRADLLWIPCGNVRSLDLIHRLEAATGRAVISSNQALLWRMLAEIGVPWRPVNATRLAGSAPIREVTRL